MITPQEKEPRLAAELGVFDLYFKREDLHPFSSHKGRSIPFMIDEYRAKGKTHFAISSSGNAAIAAAMYIRELNSHTEEKLKLDIFIGEHINPEKEEILKHYTDEYLTLKKTPRPLQSLFAATQDSNIQALRQSNDDTALQGYETLAQELVNINDLKAVFIPTSSGTTAQALAFYFEKLGKKIEIHIVQTMSCHPFAEQFTNIMETDEISLADAIVDKTALRKQKLIEAIKNSGGFGYVVTNEEIESAQQLAKNHTTISLSANSALSLAGLMQALYTGRTWNGSIACLITGK